VNKILISSVIAGVALTAAACGPTVTNGAAVRPSGSATTTTTAPADSAPATLATEGVGESFAVSGSDDNGNPDSYNVTLVRVVQDASPDNSFDSAPAGKHLVGAEFRIAGVTGDSSDDANSDAVAVGANDQVYSFGFEGLADGTNFAAGDWSVSPGTTEKGWVSFEVPDGVKITSIQWNPSGGFSDTTATWGL
jgi:hypothetical protein